jgi:tape measure domain-containing protein
MSREIEVGMRINGDARSARDAIGSTRSDLEGMATQAKSIRLLDGDSVATDKIMGEIAEVRKSLADLAKVETRIATFDALIQQTDRFKSELTQAEANVNRLKATLSEAYDSGADKSLIKNLERQLVSAEKEAKRASDGIQKTTTEIVRLNLEADKTGVSMSNLAQKKAEVAEQAEALRSRVSGVTQEMFKAATEASALSNAFRTLGVKPLQDVRNETERLQEALARVKASGIGGPDQERVVAAFNAKIAALRTEAGLTANAVSKAGGAASSLAHESARAGDALAHAARGAVAWAGALAGVSSIGMVAKNIVDTGAAFETLEARLTSLLGSAGAAKDAMAQIKELAITTPFEVTALADSFTKLTAFGLQPSMSQMRALADTAATLGGGTETLAGVTLALGQAWTKGKLQGEEILQLAERGVPVWDVLAQVTGKNTAELQKMSEAGELGRGTILKLVDALGKVNAGASEKLMATFSGAVSNARDALAEFYDMVAKAGVLDFLTKQIQDLLAEFDRMKKTGELQAEAKRLADSFVSIGEGVRAAITAVRSLSEVVKLSAEAWVAWKLAGLGTIPVLTAVGRQAAITAAETTAMAVATEKATLGMRALAGAGKMLSGLAGLAVIEWTAGKLMDLGKAIHEYRVSVKNADDAEKRLAETQEMARNGQSRLAREVRAVATETEAARFKLTEYQRAMEELRADGKSTADALSLMVKKADLGNVGGVVEMLRGLKSVREGAQATGEQIRQSIQERLNRMTAGELREFGEMAKIAFNRAEIGAEQLEIVLNGSVDAALKNLGSSTETWAGGMTAKFIESSVAVGVVEASFLRLQGTGQNASAILKEAFEGAFKSASSIKDLEALEVSIRKAGEAGQLSKRDVSEFLESIRTKTDAATPGVNSLAEAFRELGMKSPAELKKTADTFREAYETIKAHSGSTQGELSNLREAFKRYAEASIAANGGVASYSLKVEAGMRGMRVEVDAAGKAIIRTSNAASSFPDAAERAASGFNSIGDAAERAASGFNSIGDAAERAGRKVDGVKSKIDGVGHGGGGRGGGGGGSGGDGDGGDGGGGKNDHPAGKQDDEKEKKVVQGSFLDGDSWKNDYDRSSILDDPAVRNRKNTVDVYRILVQAGASMEEADLAQKYYGELWRRGEMTELTGNLGTATNATQKTNALAKRSAEQAIEMAREEMRTGKAVDMGESADRLLAYAQAKDRFHAYTPDGGDAHQIALIKQAGNQAKASMPTRRYQVDLRLNNGKPATLFTDDQQSAEAFVDHLGRMSKAVRG